jgi:hypothetical protein
MEQVSVDSDKVLLDEPMIELLSIIPVDGTIDSSHAVRVADESIKDSVDRYI